MTLTPTVELKCDLCDHPPVRHESLAAAQKIGWVELTLSHYMEDRAFFKKHVCPSCRKDIERKIKLVPVG